jgi:site-specific DNA-methyltransferase (adenine-specific)
MLADDASYILRQGDCARLLGLVPEASVDLVVTSPPYDGLSAYRKRMTWSYFRTVASGLYRAVKDGGVLVWIAADRAGDRGGCFRQAMSFVEDDGFTLYDVMMHRKAPLLSEGRYRQAFEYMFILSKGEPGAVCLLTDPPEAEGRKAGRPPRPVPRDNVWTYSTGNEATPSRLASVPLALALDHVKSWSREGDLVLDPFLRAGTTGVAAMLAGRRFIGFEKEKRYLEVAGERLASWQTESVAVGQPCFSDDLYEAWDA